MNKWIVGISIAIFTVVLIMALAVNDIFDTVHNTVCKNARNYVQTYKECIVDTECKETLGFTEHKEYANKKEFYLEYCDESKKE